MNRREFLKKSGLSVVAVAAIPAYAYVDREKARETKKAINGGIDWANDGTGHEHYQRRINDQSPE